MSALYPVIAGYVPLVDAALLIVAKEEGFAAAQGIDLTLVRENSWATLRDRLAVRHFDAAHMLAPAALAMHLALGHMRCRLSLPMALSRDGNAITVSTALAAALRDEVGDSAGPVGVERTAQAMAAIVARRRASGARPLVVGTVFGYSCHTYQLSTWLSAAGLTLGEDLALVVMPPPLMVDALKAGVIDLFCAGSPWNSLARGAGAGEILHPCALVTPNILEKVLAVPEGEADAAWLPGLLAALMEAARFCGDPDQRGVVARHLARPDYVNVPAPIVEAVLRGTTPTVFPREDRAWIALDEAATALDASAFEPLVALMARSGHLPAADVGAARRSIVEMIRPLA